MKNRCAVTATLPDIGKPRTNVKIAINNINGYHRVCYIELGICR